MAGFTIRKLCEDIKSTLQEWFKGYPDNMEEGCPKLEYGMDHIIDNWNDDLEEFFQSRKDIRHLPWYQIRLAEKREEGTELALEIRFSIEHPMVCFFSGETLFTYNLGNFVYQRYTSRDTDPYSGLHPEREICADLEYCDTELYMNDSLEDVLKWIESQIHANYEKIRILDAYMADKTPDENEAFVNALFGLFPIEDTQLEFDAVMDADWRIAFINAWENA
jgi:hypothetical protein